MKADELWRASSLLTAAICACQRADVEPELLHRLLEVKAEVVGKARAAGGDE